MVKLNLAGSTIIGLPKEMVFLDEKKKGHIYPTLTPKNHLASHYGIPAIVLENKKGYTVGTVKKSMFTDSSNTNIVNAVKKARAKTEKARTRKTAAEREQMKADKEAKKAERLKKKADNEAKKAEREAKKAEKEKMKAERVAKTAAKNKAKYDKYQPNLVNKINASVMANDMFDNLLPGAMASLPQAKRGRPKKKVQ